MNRAVRVLALASMATIACSRQQAIDAASGEDDAGAPVDAWGDAGPDAAVDANLDANDLDAGDIDAGDLDAGDIDAGDIDADDPFAAVDAFDAPDAYALAPPDAFVGVDAFDAPDAFRPPDAFVGVDAYDAPDAFRPPDAFVGVDAYDAPDAFRPPDSPIFPPDVSVTSAFAPTLTFAAPMTATLITAAAPLRGGFVAVGSDASSAHGRVLYLGPSRTSFDSSFVEFTAGTTTTQLRAIADNTAVGTGTMSGLKRGIVARIDTTGITALKTYTVLGRTTAFEDVVSTGTQLVVAGGVQSSGLIAVIPAALDLPTALNGFEVSVDDGANLTFTSVAVSGSLVVVGFVGTSRGLIAFDTAGAGSVRWMVTFSWTPRDMTFTTGGALLVVGDDGVNGVRALFSTVGDRLASATLGGTRLRSVLVTSGGEEWMTGISGVSDMHVVHYDGTWADSLFSTLPTSLGLTEADGSALVVGGKPSGPPMYSTTAFAPVTCSAPITRPVLPDFTPYPVPTTAGVHVAVVTVGEFEEVSTGASTMMVAPGCP